jgi:carnitine O-acetyltransferase
MYKALTLPHFSCASSKHLQTRRFLDTLKGYLYDVQRILIQLHRDANERPAPFVDHSGILRDSKTGRAINGSADAPAEEEIEFRKCSSALCDLSAKQPTAGYSFFDTGDVMLLGQRKPTPYSNVGGLTFSFYGIGSIEIEIPSR